MQIGSGAHTYTWHGDWAQLPGDIQLGYTHGVAVAKDGRVFVFNQSPHAVVIFNPDGSFAGTWEGMPSNRFLGAHGLTLIDEGGEQFLWLTDQRSGEVVKTTLDGATVQSIEKPDAGVYAAEDAKYSPTWVAQSPEDGTIYVADGYGSGVINRYDRTGGYLDTMTGEDGAGRFACPHGVWIGERKQATGRDEPVLYVTDRGNGRIQVFDLAGAFIKSFEQQHPCSFDEHDGLLLCPDLHAFVRLYDAQDQVAAELGDNRDIVGEHGWPNVPHDLRQPGKFNSPHGGCFDADGNIFVVEWISDGRITKLEKA